METHELLVDGKKYRVALGPHGANVKLWQLMLVGRGWRWRWDRAPLGDARKVAQLARTLAEESS